MPTLKGSAISLSGGSLWQTSASARLGATAACQTVWVSLSTVITKASSGFGHGKEAALTIVSPFISNFSSGVSYNHPSLDPLDRPSNAPTSGRVTLMLFGTNLGPFDKTPRAALGGSACLQTLWAADSLIKCLVPGARQLESGCKDVLLELTPFALTLADALEYDPIAAMLPAQVRAFP